MRIAFIIAVMTLCAPALSLLANPVRSDSSILLVLHAPWRDGRALAESLGSRMIGPQTAPVGFLVMVDDPSAISALQKAPLWVFDGAAIAALCGVRA